MTADFANTSALLMLLFACIGLILGSFGNVIIFRVPEHRSIGGRSHCMGCNRTLSPLELIPVLSFLALRGRCRTCRMQISYQYPLVEMGSGLLFVYALLQSNLDIPQAALLGTALWLLFLIAIIDARTTLIPDALNLPLLGIGIALQLVTNGAFDFSGVALGAGFFALQWIISRGRWVGSGDIILGAGIGALLVTWQHVALFLFCSYIIGALIASFLLLTRFKTLKDAIPFGPFLVFGAFVTIVFGEALKAVFLPMY